MSSNQNESTDDEPDGQDIQDRHNNNSKKTLLLNKSGSSVNKIPNPSLTSLKTDRVSKQSIKDRDNDSTVKPTVDNSCLPVDSFRSSSKSAITNKENKTQSSDVPITPTMLLYPNTETSSSSSVNIDNSYRRLTSILGTERLASKSDENLWRESREVHRGSSSCVFSTTNYLNSLTNITNEKSQRESSTLNTRNETEKTVKSKQGLKSNDSLLSRSQSKSRIEKIWCDLTYLDLQSKLLTKRDYKRVNQAPCGPVITYKPFQEVDSFVTNRQFFSTFFKNEIESKPDTELLPAAKPISYNKSVMEKFVATSQQISSNSKKLLQLGTSKLLPKSVRKKVTQAEKNLAKSKDTKFGVKSAPPPGRTYSSLSVDSQKSIYHLNLINKSLTLLGKTGSTISSDTFLLKENKSPRSPSVLTPAEVMVRGYVFHREVTTGSFSTLYECSCFSMPDRELACKHIRSSELIAKKECLKDFLEEEMAIMQRVSHPNIIEMYEIVTTSTDVYIFMKFASKGTIFDYLYKEWRKPLPETYAKRWMKHLMSALLYVHGLKIVHRDLKLENFLLDDKFTALLSDFGLAVCLDSQNAPKLMAVHCGTTDYMAPEQHMAANFSNNFYDPFPADIYAMGVCLFEMVNYYRPFAISFSESYGSVVFRQRHRKYEFNKRIFLEQQCHELLDLLLEPNPTQRPKAKEVLEHAWFQLQIR